MVSRRQLKAPLKLSLLGRAVLLAVLEIIANVICWIAAVILFGRTSYTRPILNLTLLSWTLGLRHALDADHISAIDNATRRLISLGQLPVSCGLFFSLGHSTIVVAVTVAISISSDVIQRLQRVEDVGGIIGAAVSGSFLFLVGTANAIILWKICKKRSNDDTGLSNNREETPGDSHMLMMRVLGPVVEFVDRPWKMYPVGVLFGFGFDTASSVALLSVSAIAKKGADGRSIPSSQIIILPLLFTAGMTMIDSADSILMLYSYAGFSERSWAIFQHSDYNVSSRPANQDAQEKVEDLPLGGLANNSDIQRSDMGFEIRIEKERRIRLHVMSSLSILLTLMSIMVAYAISIIVIMGLIGDRCRSCRAAADADDGGLAGRWWRTWRMANDNSGYIGVGIVGMFVLSVGGWYGCRWFARKARTNRCGIGQRS